MRDKMNYLVVVFFLAAVFLLPGTANADTQDETIQDASGSLQEERVRG